MKRIRIVVALIASVVGFGWQSPVAGQDAESDLSRGRERVTIRFSVVDSIGGEPIAGAVMDGRAWGGGLGQQSLSAITDSAGRMTVTVPDSESAIRHRYAITAAGYQRYNVEPPLSKPSDLDREKTIRMKPGRPVRGVVVNLEGEPVAGARVDFYRQVDETEMQSFVANVAELTTDDQGRFDGGSVADQRHDQSHVNISVEHGDYETIHPNFDGFGPYRFVLTPATVATGRVLDFRGQPLAGVTVQSGEDPFGTSGRFQTTSDQEGHFSVRIDPGSNYLTFTGPRRTPQVRRFDSDADDLTIRMLPGRVIRFHCQDIDGNPIPGVRILADTWWPTLDDEERPLRTLHCEGRTGEDGNLVLRNAPAGRVAWDVLHRQYRSVRDRTLTAVAEPHVVVLHRDLHVSGNIRDAFTGQPITPVTVTVGRLSVSDGQNRFVSSNATLSKAGRYEVVMDEPWQTTLRFEAAGYEPLIEGPFEETPYRQTFDAQMQPLARSPAGPSPGATSRQP